MDTRNGPTGEFRVEEYSDEIHSEDHEGLIVGHHGYKYRLINGIVMPPYITPARYQFSRTLKTRAGDICYTSYPKSGSTWLAYILVLIVNSGEIPARNETLRNSLHWVASAWTYPRSPSEIEAAPSPRIFKSHMPYHMAVGGDPRENPCKYVYIARNPKDVAVSYYYFERGKSWSGYYAGTWNHWLDIFMKGRVQRGSWFDHTLSWWQQRDAANILFLRYEDLLADFEKGLEKLMAYLDYPLDRDVIDKIREKTTFENMQREEFCNMHEIKEFHGFFRKGRVRSWQEQFTKEQSEAFDRLYREKMKGSGLEFDLS